MAHIALFMRDLDGGGIQKIFLQLAGALQQYTTALRIYADHSDGLMKMTIPPALTESNRATRRNLPWGAPTRVVRVANIPERLQMLMGNTDEMNLQVLQSGPGSLEFHLRHIEL